MGGRILVDRAPLIFCLHPVSLVPSSAPASSTSLLWIFSGFIVSEVLCLNAFVLDIRTITQWISSLESNTMNKEALSLAVGQPGTAGLSWWSVYPPSPWALGLVQAGYVSRSYCWVTWLSMGSSGCLRWDQGRLRPLSPQCHSVSLVSNASLGIPNPSGTWLSAKRGDSEDEALP